jgi:hypothetical protein
MRLSNYQRLEQLALFGRRRGSRRKNRARRAAIYGGAGLGLIAVGLGARHLLKGQRNRSRNTSTGPDMRGVENYKKRVKTQLDNSLEKQRRYHRETMNKLNKMTNSPNRQSLEDFQKQLDDPNYVWRL